MAVPVDSLRLFTPAQYDALPGIDFPAPADTDPDKDQVADYPQAYAAAFDLPSPASRADLMLATSAHWPTRQGS